MALVFRATQGRLQHLQLRLVRFAEVTTSRMLACASALAADSTWRPIDKFSALMDVHICTSHVSEILIPSLLGETRSQPNSEEMPNLLNKIQYAFQSTKDNLGQAIHCITKDAEAVTPLLSKDSCETFLRSAEIHKATKIIMDYARLFSRYRNELELVLELNCGLPPYDDRCLGSRLVRRIIKQTISNLIDLLEKKSESISDRSLRYLFLLNNSHFIQDALVIIGGYSLSDSGIEVTYRRYQEIYLNISWDPMLSCLQGKMPLWFSKPSPLARFESEFRRTCRHQKLWSVPSPELRKSLRKAVIYKVITGPTGYKTYLKDHPEKEKCGTDPQEMEDMVNELFEG